MPFFKLSFPTSVRRRPLAWFLAATLAGAGGGMGMAWWVWLGPYGHPLPDPLPGATEFETHTIFAYGTLRHPVIRWLIVGRRVDTEKAYLPGYRKEALDVVPDPDAVTPGLIFDVTLSELRRLDRYERLGTRYERVRLPLTEGTAWVYRRLP